MKNLERLLNFFRPQTTASSSKFPKFHFSIRDLGEKKNPFETKGNKPKTQDSNQQKKIPKQFF